MCLLSPVSPLISERNNNNEVDKNTTWEWLTTKLQQLKKESEGLMLATQEEAVQINATNVRIGGKKPIK